MRPLLVLIGFLLAVLSGIAAVLSGFGSQWDWWHFATGFVILRWAAYGGIAAALVSAAGAVLTRPGRMSRGFILSVCGLIIGIVVFGIPLSWWQTVKKVPLIHDITTDTDNPPRFVSILPLPSNQAFERAYRTAKEMGWKVVDQNQAEGRIEATDTTRWFGFKDDIVIRVRPEATGSRVDVRSVSRVGKSDVGTNARRIRKYLKALSEKG